MGLLHGRRVTLLAPALVVLTSSERSLQGGGQPPPDQQFIRGEANGHGPVDIADAVTILGHLYRGNDLACLDAGDVDDDGAISVADADRLLTYLFFQGAPPAAPFPGCGTDPTGDELGCARPSVCCAPEMDPFEPLPSLPGYVIELHGACLPLSFDDLRVRFSRVGSPIPNGILGLPVRLTRNDLAVVVPTAVSSGTATVAVRHHGTFLDLSPLSTSIGPQLMGYLLPRFLRAPGIVEADATHGVTPQQVILYGLNVDNSVMWADAALVSLNRQAVRRFPTVSIDPEDRGIPVPGVTDPAIRGVRVTLPEELGEQLNRWGHVQYIRLSVRAGVMVSNRIEIPAVQWGSELLEGPTSLPWPAVVSGVWASPGVHGNLLELHYTVFQPRVALKWRPKLELSSDSGQNWTPVTAIVMPRPDSADPLDFRTELIIPGDGRQKPEVPCLAGPGTAYRLYVNVREAFGEYFSPCPWIGPGMSFGVLLRIRMISESVSHGESPVPLPGRLEGNTVEFPVIAVADAGDFEGGIIEECFARTDLFLEHDTYTRLDSTGLWGEPPGTATGAEAMAPITGMGTKPLELDGGRNYLFDTSLGRLYLFPEGADQRLITQVRQEIGMDPTSRSQIDGQNLHEVRDVADNPGASTGELHVTRLVIPAGSTLYGRGVRPLIVRINAPVEGLAARIDGEILVDGLPGADGTPDSRSFDVTAKGGAGGVAGPGGGAGGGGGRVRAGPIGTRTGVTEAMLADAGTWGGGAGQTMTYLLPERDAEPATRDCFVYGGPGGGGGFGAPGATGRAGIRADGRNSLEPGGNAWDSFGTIHRVLGTAGPARGAEDMLPLIGGSGGGGGGGFLARESADTGTRIFGVGGGGGGGGAGAFLLVARGSVNLSGTISARGGQGGVGRGKPFISLAPEALRGAGGGACGGGGSGGAIVMQTTGSLRFGPDATLDVRGGSGGRPGLTEDGAYLASPRYPLGGDGGWGRIRLEAGGGFDSLSDLTVLPENAVPSQSTLFEGSEVVSHVWSRPIPLSLGPGNGIMMTDSTVRLEETVAKLLTTEFASPVVRWRVLIDGGEALPAGRAAPDRLFGPMNDFDNLRHVGLMPSYVRFLLVFVGSTATGEVPEVDAIHIPWEPAHDQR